MGEENNSSRYRYVLVILESEMFVSLQVIQFPEPNITETKGPPRCYGLHPIFYFLKIIVAAYSPHGIDSKSSKVKFMYILPLLGFVVLILKSSTSCNKFSLAVVHF